jgi:hypothetical protein
MNCERKQPAESLRVEEHWSSAGVQTKGRMPQFLVRFIKRTEPIGFDGSLSLYRQPLEQTG